MSLILGFDTSAAHVSAALFDGQTVLADAHEVMARGQAERLIPLLEEVLAVAGHGWADLDAIGVGIGPGNFTGVRLSVAAARGLALSLGIPAVGVTLLEAAALGSDGPVLSCLQAPRDQAYVMGQGTATVIAPQLIAIADIPQSWAQPGLILTGSATGAVGTHLGLGASPARYAPASAVARIAARRWQDNPPRPAPVYLKPADAAPARDAPPVILDPAVSEK